MDAPNDTLVADADRHTSDPKSAIPTADSTRPSSEPKTGSHSKAAQAETTASETREHRKKAAKQKKSKKKHRHRKSQVSSDSSSLSDSDTEDGVDRTQRKTPASPSRGPVTWVGKPSAGLPKLAEKGPGRDARANLEESRHSSDSSCFSSSSSSYSSSEEDKRRRSERKTRDQDRALKEDLGRLQAQVMQLHRQLSHQPMPAVPPPYGYPAYGYPGPSFMHQPPPPPPPPPVSTLPPIEQPAHLRGITIQPKARVSPLPPKVNGEDNRDADRMGSSRSNRKKTMRAEFRRVDWVWDANLLMYKLQDTTTEVETDSEFHDYIFHVRRTFDVDGRYRTTFVDIRSKLLRECLQDVMGDVRGVSLVDGTPKLSPDMLFLFLEDFREHLSQLKHLEPAGESRRERKRNQNRIDTKRKHLKVLVKYLDRDYARIKESLIPMLENGLITFDLLWALWKPNTLAYAPTYGSSDVPRVFRVELADRQASLFKEIYYHVEGKYFEYDGQRFGYGNISEEISEFSGARKITSLPCYPLEYHRDKDRLRKDLIERGKTFVSLCGVSYKSYSGVAYFRKKRNSIIKFNVRDSRVMLDSSTFRRINPNYHVSLVRPKEHDIFSDMESVISSRYDYGSPDDSDRGDDQVTPLTKVLQVAVSKAGSSQTSKKGGVELDKDQRNHDGVDTGVQQSEKQPDGDQKTDETANDVEEFADEDYLIASPVVLGFSFSEKVWLEFAVANVKEIKWNENAWGSLVLQDTTKDLIKALVESRKHNAAKTIDDVIQGKGKGLVTVLHGPPGTGKTLTAESISEELRCPLYMASAGELSTNARDLEDELQRILDICHTWGAILLLDEADVFLEKRNMHDLHRNALVSIFLRKLEYFQGILFLTTNRVETFDEAFQSRIHIALRYENLNSEAKKSIFRMFVEKVRKTGTTEVADISENDLTLLARKELNGREIKNTICAAQDLAMSKKEPLSMKQILHVMAVHVKFGRDLKGGTGYEDAMRSYM